MSKKKEYDLIYRKAIHLSSLWIPITYHFLDFFEMLLIMLIGSTMILIWDTHRSKKNFVARILKYLNKKFKLDSVLKKHEKKELSGASLMMVSGLLCMMLFDKELFIIAFTVLIICDTVACIIGIRLGKPNKDTGKSIVGSEAFLISAIIISFPLGMLYELAIIPLFIAALAATYFEHCSNILKIDDNFIVPISFCITFVIFAALV